MPYATARLAALATPLALAWAASALAQPAPSIALTEAYALLEARYPRLANADLARELFARQNELVDLSRRPTLTLRGEGRLQSEAVSFDAVEAGDQELPFEVDQPLYNLKAYGEATYTLMDGGLADAQRSLNAAQLRVDEQQAEVDAYPLKERLNRAFLGVTTLRDRAGLLDASITDVEARIDQVGAAVDLGTALRSEQTKLEVRRLELLQQRAALLDQAGALVATIASLTGQALPDTVQLVYPDLPAASVVPELARPELELLNRRAQLVLAQAALTDAQRKAKLTAFAQAGIGAPNPLNLLDSDPAPYALGGLNFAWPITDWGRTGVERQIQRLQADQIANERATLAFDLDAQTAAYRRDLERLVAQLERDDEIIALQERITAAVAAQLDEGVATSVDYLTQLNAETAARAQRAIHEAELLETQLTFLNQRGAL